MNPLSDTSSELSKDELLKILKSYEQEIEKLHQEVENSKTLKVEQTLNDENVSIENKIKENLELEIAKNIELQNTVEELNKKLIEISVSSSNEDNVSNKTTFSKEIVENLQNEVSRLETLLVKLDDDKKSLIVDKDNLIIEKDYIQQQLNKLSQVPGLSDIIGSSVKTLKPKESAEVNFDEITESVLISERNELQQKLNNLEKSIEYSVAEKVVIEREKLVEAHEQLNKLSESLSREIVKNSILESEKNKLIQDLDDARNWKTIYESNHGLQEMARYQKRLKSDNHRLSVAVDQLNSKLGSAIDNINILSQAYKKLKSDCGKSDNFEFDVSVLNQDYLSDNMKLQSQIKVLESQISSLETDCGKLRQTIKDQIGSFTQEGFLYYGMTAEQLVLINEFAKNLREGLLNLPLNDKSSELLKQNKLLTDELQIYKIKLEKYEREFFGIRLSDDEYLRNNSEVENLRKDMMKLAHENSELNLKILTLTSEISQNFKKPGEHPIFLSNTHQSSLTHLSSLPLKQPKTKLGQELLQIELLKLNLPSEEWVGDVKKVYGQLIECIEQLYEKDQEIVQQQSVIETIEKSLMSMKQHMATLYYDYSLKYETWETREKQYKQELSELINDRDDQKMRLKRISDVIEIIQNDDKDSIAIKLTEVNRKLVIYEVNESILSRKYMSMNEQYETERSLRIKLEQDFIDMETALKKRILYLEDFKSSVGMRIELLLTQLDKMVPIEDYQKIIQELEGLREDHLRVLQRETEARVTSMKYKDQSTYVLEAKSKLADLENQLIAANDKCHHLQTQLDHEKVTSLKAIKTLQSSKVSQNNEDLSQIIHDMAKFRGESSRLEVELQASQRKVNSLNQQLESLKLEKEQSLKVVESYKTREDGVITKERELQKWKRDLLSTYDGGMTRADAEDIKQKLLQTQTECNQLKQEIHRYRELAEISSLQASSLNARKQEQQSELIELQQRCLQLESRSDDDLLIGNLQKQLLSTKTSYRAFVRKYQVLRGNLRQKELALRVYETQLDEKGKTASELEYKYRVQIKALKEAIHTVSEMVLDPSNQSIPDKPLLSHDKLALVDVGLSSTNTSNDSLYQLSQNLMLSRINDTITIGTRLKEVSSQVTVLVSIAQNALERMLIAENLSRQNQAVVEDLQTENGSLLQRCQELQSACDNTNKSSLSSHIVAITEELKSYKLNSLQQKRQIKILLAEKKHYQSILNNMENNVEDLEQNKIEYEVKSWINKSLDKPLDSDENVQSSLTGSIHNDKPEITLIPEKDHLKYKRTMNPRDLTKDELLDRIKILSEKLMVTRKDVENQSMIRDQMQLKCAELQSIIDETNDKLECCDKLLIQNGLPSVYSEQFDALLTNKMNDNSNIYSARSSSHRHSNIRIEHEKLQQASSATILSMKAMLEDKNKLLEKYRDRIRELQRENRTVTKADLKAKTLLESLDKLNPSDRTNVAAGIDKDGNQSNKKLESQIEIADDIIKDRNDTINKLQSQIQFEINHKNDLESKYKSALNEIDVMKQDMILLVKRFKNSEEKYRELLDEYSHHNPHINTKYYQKSYEAEAEMKARYEMKENHDEDEKVTRRLESNPSYRELQLKYSKLQQQYQKVLKANQNEKEKNQTFRDTIDKLKNEFVKSEASHALAVVNATSNITKLTDDGEIVIVPTQELKELKSQITELREGLKSTKEDLEKSKRIREKLMQSKQNAVNEAQKLRSQIERSEAQAQAYQESLQRTRRELEETKKKEVRLREKLRLEAGSDTAAEQIAATKVTSDSNVVSNLQDANILLMQQIQSLRTELDHLTSAREGYDDKKDYQESKEDRLMVLKKRKAPSTTPPPITSQISNRDINSIPSGGSAPQIYTFALSDSDGIKEWISADDYRSQMHKKWENEKKLQKRITVLESQIEEKTDEITHLQKQLESMRDTLQSAITAKEEAHKKLSNLIKSNQETKKLTLDDVIEIEQTRHQIFELDEENRRLRRKIEVELRREITSLRHQYTVSENEVEYLNNQLSEMKKILYQQQEVLQNGPEAMIEGGNLKSLRESEERFLNQEKLKDQLEAMRKQIIVLESTILDKDSELLEIKFDLESKQEHFDYLHRRIAELESAYESSITLASDQESKSNEPNFRHISVMSKQSNEKDKSSNKGRTDVPQLFNRSKREFELEGVVDAMKHVIDKLRQENDHLRRGGIHEDDRKMIDYAKKATIEKRKAEKFEQDLKILQEKLKEQEGIQLKLTQKQNQVLSLRKTIKIKDDEIQRLNNITEELKKERDTLHDQIIIAETKIDQLQLSSQQNSSSWLQALNDEKSILEQKYDLKLSELQKSHTTEVENLLSKSDMLMAEREALTRQLKDAYQQINNQIEILNEYKSSLLYSKSSSTSQSQLVETTNQSENLVSQADYHSLQELCQKLREENSKLRDELSAFDMEFFEEIEQLKYAYSETRKQLQTYESRVN